jgi:hypothetical protein
VSGGNHSPLVFLGSQTRGGTDGLHGESRHGCTREMGIDLAGADAETTLETGRGETSSESGKNVVWTRRCRAKVLNDLGRLNLNRRLPGRLPRHHGQIAIVIRNHTDSGPYRMHGVTENGIYGLFFRPI